MSSHKPTPLILFVDDEPSNVELYQIMLTRGKNVDVMTATTVRDAMGLLNTQPADIIVSDIRMPEYDGYDFLNMVKDTPALAGSRFVFMSPLGLREEVQQGFWAGTDDYITLPSIHWEITRRLTRLVSRPIPLRNTLSTQRVMVITDEPDNVLYPKLAPALHAEGFILEFIGSGHDLNNPKNIAHYLPAWNPGLIVMIEPDSQTVGHVRDVCPRSLIVATRDQLDHEQQTDVLAAGAERFIQSSAEHILAVLRQGSL